MADRPELEGIPHLGALIEQAARLWDDAPCLHFDETGETITFADLDRRTAAVARWLRNQGIETGDRVAVMVRNRPAFPILWLGIARAGAAMVPMNVGYRSDDAHYILSHSEARLVLAQSEFKPLLDTVTARDDVPAFVKVVGHGHLADLDPFDGAAELPTLEATTLANIQYTSGTTGFPKGCMLPHGYWLAMGRRVWLDGAPYLEPGQVVLTAQPFFYIDPQWNVMTVLLSGAKLVVLDGFHPSSMWQKIRDYGVTFFYCLGSMPTLLLKMPPDPGDKNHMVRRVMCSAIPPNIHAALEERWGTPWIEAFGMTESGADIAVTADEHTDLVGTGCIGRPMHGRRADVLDHNDQPAPVGDVGELVVGGTWLMDGYFKNPEATAETLRDGWLYTGDLARRDEEGRFYYVGRKKDMIRRAGENIAAAEVEQVIEGHAAIGSAACVPVPDDIRGEEIKVYLVASNATEKPDPAELVEWCGARLANFKVPRYWAFIDSLPRTPSERVAKQVLIANSDDLTANSYDRVEDIWR